MRGGKRRAILELNYQGTSHATQRTRDAKKTDAVHENGLSAMKVSQIGRKDRLQSDWTRKRLARLVALVPVDNGCFVTA